MNWCCYEEKYDKWVSLDKTVINYQRIKAFIWLGKSFDFTHSSTEKMVAKSKGQDHENCLFIKKSFIDIVINKYYKLLQNILRICSISHVF